MSCCNGGKPLTPQERDYALAQSIANRAFAAASADNLDLASKLLETSLALCELHGERHPKHQVSWAYFTAQGVLQCKQGRRDLALTTFQKAVDITKATRGERHKWVGVALGNLAETYHDAGNDVKAESLYIEALAILESPITDEDVGSGFHQAYVNSVLLNFWPVYAKVLRGLQKETEAVAVDESIKSLEQPSE